MTTLTIRNVPRNAPWTWLSLGRQDMMRKPVLSIGYGAVFMGIGLAMSAGLWVIGFSAWIPAALSGFALVAPLFAVGFYNLSRAYDHGEAVDRKTLTTMTGSQRAQIGFLGVLLIILLLVWARIAMFIYAYFFTDTYRPLADFTTIVLTEPAGLIFLIVGTAVGALLALAAFAISVISFPMLIDRDIDAVTALIASVQTVKNQPFVMLSWALIIALMTMAGAALFVVGLAVVFPWLGHASWRAYRSLASVS